MKRGSERSRKHRPVGGPKKLREVMVIAEQEGLFRGDRTQVVRGRMPEALVRRANRDRVRYRVD
jgi:hypothetical protein